MEKTEQLKRLKEERRNADARRANAAGDYNSDALAVTPSALNTFSEKGSGYIEPTVERVAVLGYEGAKIDPVDEVEAVVGVIAVNAAEADVIKPVEPSQNSPEDANDIDGIAAGDTPGKIRSLFGPNSENKTKPDSKVHTPLEDTNPTDVFNATDGRHRLDADRLPLPERDYAISSATLHREEVDDELLPERNPKPRDLQDRRATISDATVIEPEPGRTKERVFTDLRSIDGGKKDVIFLDDDEWAKVEKQYRSDANEIIAPLKFEPPLSEKGDNAS